VENCWKMTQNMHPGNVKFGARMEQFGVRIVPAEVAFWLREKSAPKQQNLVPELRDIIKNKTAFSWASSVPIFEGL